MKTLQLLSHSKRNEKGKIYTYYSIAEPYWDKKTKKNEKRIVLYLGSLPDETAEQLRRFLKLMNAKKDIIVTNAEDIIFGEHWRYLDTAFLNHLWGQWGLSKIFPYSENKDVQTSDIAKILSIYRCLDTGSYLSAVGWFKKTALNIILNIDESQINKSRIFRELDEIENVKQDIENHLYKTLKEQDKDGLRIVFYDLTDSYFEGRKCELAKPGITKSNGFRKKKIVLSLLVNSKGYPFAWDILGDYTADVKTIKRLSVKWKMQFNFADHEVVLVFDRGMVSDKNLKHLEDQKQPYVTALDKNQIQNIKGANIERFEVLDEGNMNEQMAKMGFKKHDDKTYYEDMGVISGRRYILIFNSEMFADERKSRKELMQRVADYMEEENKVLAKAEKSRNEKVLRNKIDKKLKKMKAGKFIDYALESLVIEVDGKKINSFYIVPTETDDVQKVIKTAERTDGLWTIVTSVKSKEDDKNGLTASELISAYRDKNQIEQAFKDVKSFIKIHPFNVWEPKHVRAHYTICVLSYLLDITIANRLREKDIDIKSPQKVYEILRRGRIGKIEAYEGGKEMLKFVRPKEEEIQILNLFESKYLTGKKHLESINIHN